MAKVKVWNDNIHAHVEDFKGTKLVIPAGDFIVMDWEEAVEFKGQFTPMAPHDAPEAEKSKFYKKIRIDGKASVVHVPLVCHADGTVATDQADLNAKLLQFADRIVKDDESDKKAQGGEIAALQAQVAALAEALERITEKRPVGRPPKDKTASA